MSGFCLDAQSLHSISFLLFSSFFTFIASSGSYSIITHTTLPHPFLRDKMCMYNRGLKHAARLIKSFFLIVVKIAILCDIKALCLFFAVRWDIFLHMRPASSFLSKCGFRIGLSLRPLMYRSPLLLRSVTNIWTSVPEHVGLDLSISHIFPNERVC